MQADKLMLLVVVIVALAAALLAWFAIETGTTTLQRYRATFTERAKFQAREFFLFIDPRKLFAANMALVLIGSLGIWLLTEQWILGLLATGLLLMMPRLIYAWMRQRRLQQFEEQLPDALMMLSGGMRAGVGLSSAIQQLVRETQAPISQEFSLLLREQRLGVTIEQSLANLGRRIPTTTTALVISAMRISSEAGGSLAETLERTAQTIRSRLQMEGKIRALTAQGKMQAWVVGLLPMLLMLILNHMEPEAMGMLWNTPLGWATLTVIAFFEFMGVYVIRKIIAIDV